MNKISNKNIIILFLVFSFMILYFVIGIKILSDTREDNTECRNYLWIYNLIYVILFPFKVHLIEESNEEKINQNSIENIRRINFKISNKLDCVNISYFTFMYITEFILFIWGIIEVLNYNYNCHSGDAILIFGLFNTLMSCMFLVVYTCLICYIVIENDKNNVKIMVGNINKFDYQKKTQRDNVINRNMKCKITDI